MATGFSAGVMLYVSFVEIFPESATLLAALQDPALGVAITVAIALHNIPEGISVTVPIFYATGNRKKAFL